MHTMAALNHGIVYKSKTSKATSKFLKPKDRRPVQPFESSKTWLERIIQKILEDIQKRCDAGHRFTGPQ